MTASGDKRFTVVTYVLIIVAELFTILYVWSPEIVKTQYKLLSSQDEHLGDLRKILFNLTINERLRMLAPQNGDGFSINATNYETPRYNKSEEFVKLTDIIDKLHSPVLLTTINNGFLELLLNLLHSIQRLPDIKATMLVICEDRTAYTELTKRQSNFTLKFQLALTHFQESVSEATDRKTQPYRSLMQKRVSYIQLLLQRRLDVFFVDSDVVLLANPLPYFKDHSYDLFVQSELEGRKALCAGFFYMRANDKTRRFVRSWKRILPKDSYGSQVTFNREIIEFRTKMKTKVLPTDRFMSGKMFLKSNEPWFERSPQPIQVHANFLIGKGTKEDMLKTHSLWFVDD